MQWMMNIVIEAKAKDQPDWIWIINKWLIKFWEKKLREKKITVREMLSIYFGPHHPIGRLASFSAY